MWSRIHAELGLQPSPLTYEMIEAAVAVRMREAADLDWKGTLISADEAGGPSKQKALDDRRKEFAKDVAAMANTQGGLIVYGVTDVDEAADEIVPLRLGERERQRLGGWVNGSIRPWIPDLVIEEFPSQADPSQGILTVWVPASANAPHIIGERNAMGVPYRDGSHTQWMSEYQIERAYRDRFTRQDAEDVALDRQLVEVREQLDLESGHAWLVVAVRPSTAVSQLNAARPGRDTVSKTLSAALVLASEIQSAEQGRYPLLRQLGQSAAEAPRIGLRRWIANDKPFAGGTDAQSSEIHIELHHDGASTVALGVEAFGQGNNEPYHRVAVPYVGSALVDAVALAMSHARSRGYSGTMVVAAELVGDGVKPFGAVDQRKIGTFVTSELALVDRSKIVRKPTRVHAELSVDSDAVRLRQVAHQLDLDVVHQFGVLRGTVPEE